MSLREGTTKQPRRVHYTSDEVATLSLAMTWGIMPPSYYSNSASAAHTSHRPKLFVALAF